MDRLSDFGNELFVDRELTKRLNDPLKLVAAEFQNLARRHRIYQGTREEGETGATCNAGEWSVAVSAFTRHVVSQLEWEISWPEDGWLFPICREDDLDPGPVGEKPC